ncbi:MAG: nucleotidyl transferase AbiEii/AbiGii toxin family protein [Pirellulales bacterium]|nr:nucleotidyl transferase AbiEii/AbiGii toxin family protein [Pirellulales bacterium]
MINKETYTIEWINKKSKEHRNADKILIEKVIMAFHLLENLKLKNIDFIFKGGTSLMLILDESKRFSIDIDIVIDKKNINIETVFNEIIRDSKFTRFEKQNRKSSSGIDKTHYKFYYTPVTNARGIEEYILLDIIFEQNQYPKIKEIPIRSQFINTDNNLTSVKVPEVNCILGDKLTAFAPNTTGVPYNKGKEIEIIKQLFDIGNLFDSVNNLDLIRKTFIGFVETELKYRNISNLYYENVLDDTINTCLTISLKGIINKDNYDEIAKGIKSIVNFIFFERYNIDKAIVHASKAAYLCALLKKNNNQIERFTGDIESIKDFLIEETDYNKLNKLKKSNTEAFFYWYRAIELLK